MNKRIKKKKAKQAEVKKQMEYEKMIQDLKNVGLNIEDFSDSIYQTLSAFVDKLTRAFSAFLKEFEK
ncbi:hypothetical protein [Streptococcus pyogenes]|uniref:hypothetical protein n=1 Tax=Streptococcus pyogenes TaxID=1314 RepID=UPI0035A97D4F